MSTIFTNYLFQQEQLVEATQADSPLLKKTNDLFKTSCNLQEQKNEQDTPLLEEASKRKRHSLEFKQRVVSEMCSGKSAIEVCRSYNICQGSLNIWIRKAYASDLQYNSTAAWKFNGKIKLKKISKGKRHSLEFKQRVVSEMCSGKRVVEVCKNYNICQGSLSIWMRKAYASDLPYNSTAAWKFNGKINNSKLKKNSKSLYSK